MTATYEPHEQPSSQAGVSVLLIGDDDVVIRTSGLLWDTLPKFGEIRAVKLVPQSSVPFVDPSAFQLLFFHLSATAASTELEALRGLREKSCTLSADAVCVLVVPEAGSDVPASAADFVLTQPLTVEHVEEVLRKCSFLSEQSQNDSDSSASPISGGHQTPQPESTDPQAEPGAPVQESGAEDWPDEGLPQGPSAELTSGDLQAFLHSKKEQKRRLQIKECCDRLRELLPFIRNRMDTASTLEITVKYMSYLRQRLPEDILEETVKALEENGTGTWYKPTKAPKKRKACMVRRKPTDMPMPTSESFADDFIAAHVLGRHIQPKLGATQPTPILPLPVVTGQFFDPRLDLNLASAPGLAPGQTSAPFGQTFLMTQTQGHPADPDRCYSLPLFWQQTRGPVPMMVNRAFVPQMIQNPRAAQAMVLDEPSLPPIPAPIVGPDFFPPAGVDPALAPPAPTVPMNQTFAPLVILHDATATPPAHPTTPRPIPTPAPWPDPLLSEILYDSSPALSGLSSFQGRARVDNLLQNPTLDSPFSQWDFGCESGPVYPFHSHFLESLSPPSPHRIQIQAPGSSVHSLAEVPPPPPSTKLYGRHYFGGSDFQINEYCGNKSS